MSAGCRPARGTPPPEPRVHRTASKQALSSRAFQYQASSYCLYTSSSCFLLRATLTPHPVTPRCSPPPPPWPIITLLVTYPRVGSLPARPRRAWTGFGTTPGLDLSRYGTDRGHATPTADFVQPVAVEAPDTLPAWAPSQCTSVTLHPRLVVLPASIPMSPCQSVSVISPIVTSCPIPM